MLYNRGQEKKTGFKLQQPQSIRLSRAGISRQTTNYYSKVYSLHCIVHMLNIEVLICLRNYEYYVSGRFHTYDY
jgi:hypothetical protein